MPPPGSAVPPLTIDEKMTIARWIDLGAPINVGDDGATPWGWFLDEIRPTLALSLPRPGGNPPPVETIRIGVADAHGVAPGSLSVTADFPVAGRAPGTELADLAVASGDDVATIAIDPPLAELGERHVRAQVADLQGNVTRVDRRFYVGNPPAPPPSAGCPAAPAPGCASAASATFRVRADKRRTLGWTWRGTGALDATDLGDPRDGGTAYRLCVYDGGASLLADVPVPAARRCAKKPCWRRGRGGFRYRDPAAQAAGVARVVLRAGDAPRVVLRARGARTAAIALPLAVPEGLTVQLRRTDDAARCWDARFAATLRNTATRFDAVTP
jgi:hypothetical protein